MHRATEKAPLSRKETAAVSARVAQTSRRSEVGLTAGPADEHLLLPHFSQATCARKTGQH